jgi:hypothetical protein
VCKRFLLINAKCWRENSFRNCISEARRADEAFSTSLTVLADAEKRFSHNQSGNYFYSARFDAFAAVADEFDPWWNRKNK